MKKLLFLLLISFASFSQNVVQDIVNVKKPAEGKLYYSKKDKTLYLYGDTFVAISPSNSQVTQPNTGAEEIVLGYWAVSERILIAKLLGGQYYLMQTNASRGLYVPRGKNLLINHETKLSVANLPNIISQNSDLGGLYPAPNFPEAELLKLGFKKNAQGEYVK
jgi:hypothetical protein